jgi:hypothetical protein
MIWYKKKHHTPTSREVLRDVVYFLNTKQLYEMVPKEYGGVDICRLR